MSDTEEGLQAHRAARRMTQAEAAKLSFGNRLRAHRAAQRMTQADVAKVVGCAQHTVHHWETGTTEPRITDILSLSKLFKVTTGVLIHGPSKRRPAKAKG